MKARATLRTLIGGLAGGMLLLALVSCKGDDPVNSVNPTEGASAERLRIEVKRSGWIRLAFEDLLARGFHQGMYEVSRLRMTNQGQPVALRIAARNHAFLQPGDHLEFYAAPLETTFTDTNVYWLSLGEGNPVPPGPVDGTPSANAEVIEACRDTLRVEENKLFWVRTPGAPAQEYWFWEKLTAPVMREFGFQVPGLSEASGPSTLKVRFQGQTSGAVNPDHRTRVSLNGTVVGDDTWDGVEAFLQEITLPEGLLKPGANSLSIELPGGTGAAADIVYLDYVELGFGRPIQALDDEARFSCSAEGQAIRVDGFTTAQIEILDITDPPHPQVVTAPLIAPSASGFSARFQASGAGLRTYLAFAPHRIFAPQKTEVWVSGSLKDPGQGADYLLIAPRAFLDAAEPLCHLRRTQGLRVLSVAVEDIFNEFSQGLPDPQALQDFLRYASQSWVAPAPGYVLLLGDATLDYRDFMQTGKASRVPTHFSITDELGLTPDDNWFVSLGEPDGLPRMKLGRLPASTAAQVSALVQKLLDYEASAVVASPKALFVADNNVPVFEEECDALALLLPASFVSRKVYLSQYTDYSLAAQAIRSSLDEGMAITTYSGHGDVTTWAGERVFDLASVPLLNNGDHPTFAFIQNCLNGFFGMPGSYCLAETLVAPPDRGAIAVFASSGIGFTWEHELLARELFGLLFQGAGQPTLGDACTRAKLQAHAAGASMDVVTTFTLFGDPALRLKVP